MALFSLPQREGVGTLGDVWQAAGHDLRRSPTALSMRRQYPLHTRGVLAATPHFFISSSRRVKVDDAAPRWCNPEILCFEVILSVCKKYRHKCFMLYIVLFGNF